jgi:flavin reductase (DIM6/NTAB) family NADH-FMN oxidoreductase RutF
MESDPEQAYRRAMGAFVTGVTVVTATGADGVLMGMTVNSLTSASLNPRMLLWCLGDKCAHRAVFAEAETWGVTVLDADAEALARRFARARSQRVAHEEKERFAGVSVLRGGVAHLSCRTHDRHRAGDHLVIIGKVEDARAAPGAALAFFRGQYGPIDAVTDSGSED